MNLPNPPGLLIAPILFYLFYRLFPRATHCLFIALGLSTYRSNPASFKTMLETCSTSHNQWKFDKICQGNVSLLGMEVMVYTIAIICVFTEVEGIVRRESVKGGKVA